MKYDKTIFFLLNRAYRPLERKINHLFKGCEIEAGSFFMLCAIDITTDSTMRVLAEHLGIDPSGLSHVVLRLVEKGLILKKVGHDKRKVIVALTVKGKAIVDKYMPLVDNLNKEILKADLYLMQTFNLLSSKYR
jgi:DNA-binding MarR family transcriptional regulator